MPGTRREQLLVRSVRQVGDELLQPRALARRIACDLHERCLGVFEVEPVLVLLEVGLDEAEREGGGRMQGVPVLSQRIRFCCSLTDGSS